MSAARPKLAVWKFASCDGCQLSLLDCEDDLLKIAEAIEIAYFREATRVDIEGPYDISIVEGSVTAPEHGEVAWLDPAGLLHSDDASRTVAL